MNKLFSQVLHFQVKQDKTEEFEKLIRIIQINQEKQDGCISVKYMKRFYTFDNVKSGEAPRELTKIIKCVKYYGFFEFDTIENCGKAIAWLFNTYEKELMRLLICPFDIMSGFSL